MDLNHSILGLEDFGGSMARRSGFGAFIRAAARAAAASERERNRAARMQLAYARQVEREERRDAAQRHRDERRLAAQQAREDREAEKALKAQYLLDRQAETDDLNAELSEQVEALEDILPHTLRRDDVIDFDSLRHFEPFAPFDIAAELRPAEPPPLITVPAPSGFKRLIPGAGKRHQLAKEKARIQNQQRLESFELWEEDKRAQVATLRDQYLQKKSAYEAEMARRNAEVDEFQAAYQAREGDAVIAYNEMVLVRSEYPEEGFPQKFRMTYLEENKTLVVEYELPHISVVPTELEHRYVKTRDQIDTKARKPADIKRLYQGVIAAITLRTLHELFEADQADALALVTFNGIVDTIDPSNGREVRVPVVSVRAEKSEFQELLLDRVDMIACLRNLGAHVSSRPDELQAIKPIVEFDMVDKRFIEQGDVLSDLESRPNLLDLTPGEFEVLVSNLFSSMGLDTKLTRASRDGGVDAVAFDTRPILGGKVVIQAKRYRDTVGVAAVRDLFGTMMNEGATKGILVCTSGYGVDAYKFSQDKPIELIDGGGLLYLLREHAGIEAKILV
ncbi:restriction endonuclease [Achromobacter dolens]|uniref:restriction endonuclease n=1 Tax=Achromobacter dolens TaxID=1287738 RepID=UPI001F07ACF5|nr:restriction endonuclease [Achromobacter dolens]